MNMSGSEGGFYCLRSGDRARRIKTISRTKKNSNCPIIRRRGAKVLRPIRKHYIQCPTYGLSFTNTSYYAHIP